MGAQFNFRVEFHAGVAELLVHPTAGVAQFFQHDQRQRADFLPSQLFAFEMLVFLPCHEHVVQLEAALPGQLFLGNGRVHKGHIDFSGSQQPEGLGAGAVDHLNAHAGVLVVPFLQIRQQKPAGHRIRRADPKRTFPELLEHLQLVLGLADGFQRRGDHGVQLLGLHRGFHRTAGTHKQLHFQHGFQLADALADSALGHVQPGCRLGKGAAFVHFRKYPVGIQREFPLHIHPPLLEILIKTAII